VSDRRHEAGREARILATVLQAEFDRSRVFVGFGGISAGADWRDEAERRVADASMMIVAIGRSRLRGGCSKRDSVDLVEFEVAHARQEGILVMSGLVRGARPASA
jgi:hypothetical protein